MMSPELPVLAPMALAVTAAYIVFGMTGFGATIVAMPLLVHVQPLTIAVPMMLLLDLVATITVGSRNWRIALRSEALRLGPPMFIGIVGGAAALSLLHPKPLLLALGIFVAANSVWSLWASNLQEQTIRPRWAIPAGLVGGVFSAAFGTGGPIYTIYLARRVHDVTVFRATIALVILMSALLRFAVFGAAGLLSNQELLMLAAVMLPFCLTGLYTGSKLRHRVAPQRLRQMILILLLFGAAAVIARALKS